jgi:DNA polymerase sigma
MQGNKNQNRLCVIFFIFIKILNFLFSVEKEDGTNAVLVFKNILEKYPLIKNVVLFLKYILRKKGKNDNYTGGMSSYLLLNLVYGWVLKLNEDEKSSNSRNFNIELFLKSFLEYFSNEKEWENYIFKICNGKFSTYLKNSFNSSHPYNKLIFEDFLQNGRYLSSNTNYEVISGIFKEILNKINDKKIINNSYLLSFIDLSPELSDRAVYLKSHRQII